MPKIRKLMGLALIALALITAPGCGFNTQTKIAQGERILITSVKDGMAEWRDFVNAGKAKQSQIDAVKTAYNTYYAAQQVVHGILDKMAAKDPTATEADAVNANNAVTKAEQALLDLLNTYLLRK